MMLATFAPSLRSDRLASEVNATNTQYEATFSISNLTGNKMLKEFCFNDDDTIGTVEVEIKKTMDAKGMLEPSVSCADNNHSTHVGDLNPLYDPSMNLITLESAETAGSHVVASDISFRDDEQRASNSDTDEQERKLVLASVKHVDCQDFPFEEVLSLEDTVKKELGSTITCHNTPASRMRHRSNNKPIPSVLQLSQDTFPEVKKRPLCKTNNLSARRNRPPLLKCPTWPKSEFYEESNNENFAVNDTAKSEPISKLDSPSFYSSTAIDFSAISHLSEEHDKLMAQENAEKMSRKHAYISLTTKEKLYGKATQRSISSNGKARRESYKNKESKSSSSFSVTSVSLNEMIDTQPTLSIGKQISSAKTGKGFADPPSRKASKSSISPLEKEFRKRYSSASGITVTSTPFTSLQNDGGKQAVVLTTQSLSSVESLLAPDSFDTGKKQPNAPVEKQPLPPEGFKISRYPLKKRSATFSPSSPSDVFDQNANNDADLLQIIGDLRMQLKRSDEKIAELEAQAREWKETAQKTLQAAQFIKAQLEIEKARPSGVANKICGSKLSIEGKQIFTRQEVIPRRWSNDDPAAKKENWPNSRPRVVSADNIIGSMNNIGYEGSSTLKRTHSPERGHNKRMRVNTTDSKSSKDAANNSLLAWLSSTGPDEDYLDYMTFLEAPLPDHRVSAEAVASKEKEKISGNVILQSLPKLQPNLTQRSISHDQVRKALRAKVEGQKSETQDDELPGNALNHNFPPKLPLKVQNSLDRFLEGLTSFSPESEMTGSHEAATNFTETESSESLRLPSSHVQGISHSLSDSELNVCEGKKLTSSEPSAHNKTILSRRMSNSEGNLNKVSCVLTDVPIQKNEDFLNQLDSILDL